MLRSAARTKYSIAVRCDTRKRVTCAVCLMCSIIFLDATQDDMTSPSDFSRKGKHALRAKPKGNILVPIVEHILSGPATTGTAQQIAFIAAGSWPATMLTRDPSKHPMCNIHLKPLLLKSTQRQTKQSHMHIRKQKSDCVSLRSHVSNVLNCYSLLSTRRLSILLLLKQFFCCCF